MAKRPVILAPDRRLKVKSEAVETVDDKVRALLDDLMDTMYAEDGIGLAAIQIGVPKRCLVVDVHVADGPPAPLKLVNPTIVWRAEETRVCEEGCLSFPEQFAEVKRSTSIRVRYQDENGELRELEAGEMLAICLQHEMDHLDGILFVDHLSLIKRNIVLRKMAKAKRTADTSD